MRKTTEIILIFVIFFHWSHILLVHGIPDGVVWTKPMTTFWLGEKSSNLSCHFRGTPFLVSWMKGSSLSSAKTLITWYRGSQTGPGLDDSLLMTDDFSLVFNRLDASRSGRYICRVANHNGKWMYNSTDVRVLDPTDYVLATLPNITAWTGHSAILPCDFDAKPSRVIWNRERTDKSTTSVETMARYQNEVFEYFGDERFTMNKDFALIIRGVRVRDEANFTCHLTRANGEQLKNSTEMTVNGRAEQPYVRIPQCWNQREGCVLQVNQRNIFLNCSVHGVRPTVRITWERQNLEPVGSMTEHLRKRADGTFDQARALRAEIGPSSRNATFTCIAHGIAVDGTFSQNITLYVTDKESGEGKSPLTLIVGLFLGIIGVVIFVVIVVIMVKRKKQIAACLQCNSPREGTNDVELMRLCDDLGEMRTKITKYKPNFASNEQSAINIGVFGVMGSGKSAFINSVLFAYSGKYKQVAVEAAGYHGGSETLSIDEIGLTDGINLFDNKGSKDNDDYNVDRYMARIRGSKIHCPIFIAKISDERAGSDMIPFVIKFFDQVKRHYGQRGMVVLTNKDKLSNLVDFKNELHARINIPKDDIMVLQNYTEDQHEEDPARSRELLEFLWLCVKRAKRNIKFKQKRAERYSFDVEDPEFTFVPKLKKGDDRP